VLNKLLKNLRDSAEKATQGEIFSRGRYTCTITAGEKPTDSIYSTPIRVGSFSPDKTDHRPFDKNTIDELPMEENADWIVLANPQNILLILEAMDKMRGALEIYAGLKEDFAVWNGCKFLTFDDIGGLCEENSGAYYARQTLKEVFKDE
jgi:hypothetical protein